MFKPASKHKIVKEINTWTTNSYSKNHKIYYYELFGPWPMFPSSIMRTLTFNKID